MLKSNKWIVAILFTMLTYGTMPYFAALPAKVYAAVPSCTESAKARPLPIAGQITAADALGQKILLALDSGDYNTYQSYFSKEAKKENAPSEARFMQLREQLLQHGGHYLSKKLVLSNVVMSNTILTYHGNFEKNHGANLIHITVSTNAKSAEIEPQALNFSIEWFEPANVNTYGQIAKTMLVALSDGDIETFHSGLVKPELSPQKFAQLRHQFTDVVGPYTANTIDRKFIFMSEKDGMAFLLYRDRTKQGRFDLQVGIKKINDQYKVAHWNLDTLSFYYLDAADRIAEEFFTGLGTNDYAVFTKYMTQKRKAGTPPQALEWLYNSIDKAAYVEKDLEDVTFKGNRLLFTYNVLFAGQDDYARVGILMSTDPAQENFYIDNFKLLHHKNVK